MKSPNINIDLPLSFNQIVELIKQLPFKEKEKLRDLLNDDIDLSSEDDKIKTYFASENVLAKDWLLPEEDEAWKDL